MRATIAVALLSLSPALGQLTNLRPKAGTQAAAATNVNIMGGIGIKDGKYLPAYAPRLDDTAAKQASGYSSSWSAPAPAMSYAPAPAYTDTSGFSPEQLEFLRRKQEETGGASPQAQAHLERSWDTPSRPSSGSSYGGRPSPAGFTFARSYAPAYAPSYLEPRLDALPASTGSSAVAAVGGFAAGFLLMLAVVLRRQGSGAIGQPLLN